MTNPKLKADLSSGKFVVAPGIYDGLSARIADQSGFDALYMTGYGVSASLLGKPDAGYLTATHMADRVRTFCSIIKTPLIADADTGFGGLVNVQDAVRGYEHGGASAIQLEDQQFPKKCGHTKNRSVIDIDEAATKIKVAVETRDSSDFLVIARTDARSSLGLDEALKRGERFLEAGADILFIESPQSEEELYQIGQRFKGTWLLANMVEGGHTPLLPSTELTSMGFNIAIHPVMASQAIAQTLTDVYGQFAATENHDVSQMTFETLTETVGFQEVWDLDEKSALTRSPAPRP
ncbi:MAG: isocitrate lyase/PEP mutase family protein [Parvibaculaceae bacterium]|nr:isocitrate lyase/PEP mutase family protein [Parvibaculaceae bacterium]